MAAARDRSSGGTDHSGTESGHTGAVGSLESLTNKAARPNLAAPS